MKLSELKKLCADSLELYYDVKIIKTKIQSGRSILYNTAIKTLKQKEAKLEKIMAILNEYSFIFTTTVKTLKDKISQEILDSENMYLAIKPVGQNKVVEHECCADETVVKNLYELQICRKIYNITVLQFTSKEDVIHSECAKINLLEEGIIRSYNFKTSVEQLERCVPGFQDIMWDIVKENVENSFKEKLNLSENKVESLQGKVNVSKSELTEIENNLDSKELDLIK